MLLSFVFTPLKSIDQDLLTVITVMISYILCCIWEPYDLFCLEYKFLIYHDLYAHLLCFYDDGDLNDIVKELIRVKWILVHCLCV